MNVPQHESAYVSASRRGLGTLLVAASPGSYIADEDPDERRLHVHRFGRGAPAAIRVDPERE